MSYVLRHRPQAIGLHLDELGRTVVDELVKTAVSHKKVIDRALIEQVVATDDKKQFAISPDGIKIRASQGHSMQVNLGLTAVNPKSCLFHDGDEIHGINQQAGIETTPSPACPPICRLRNSSQSW